jgi:hypothetical protein
MAKKHMKNILTITGHKGHANQNHTKIPPYSSVKIATSRILPTTNVGDNAGEKELLVGM